MKSRMIPAFIACLGMAFNLSFGQFVKNPSNANPPPPPSNEAPSTPSGDTVVIHMAALDQPFFYNRMGAAQPTGMIFALERDIVSKVNPTGPKLPGQVKLRDGKRPRPIVLRANQGDVVVIHFTNYLRPFKGDEEISIYPPEKVSQDDVNPIYPATRDAGVHITGMQLVGDISSDGSFVGNNPNSLVAPGDSITYMLFAGAPGNYLISSDGALVGNGALRGGTRTLGLFGMMMVEPPLSEWYRSQVTEEVLWAATTGWKTPDGVSKPKNKRLSTPQSRQEQYDKGWFPMINYDAVGPDGTPLLKMYTQKGNTRTLVHSDLTAIITGPKTNLVPYNWPDSFSTTVPEFFPVYATPERLQPYREFAIMYHEVPWAVQTFPEFYVNDPGAGVGNIVETVVGGLDQFAINYGTGGISGEIFANRIGVGPMADCIECAYEEFFLSSWAVGDPAMVVNRPANVSAEIEKQRNEKIEGNKLLNELMLQQVVLVEGGIGELGGEPSNAGEIESKADYTYYADDPSNVYHSYMNDNVKFRIGHTGTGITHVHHQHAAQWLHSPNNQNGHYLDSQTINPGATYTLDMVYGGSGNVNKTVGDKIFHCHFYPHFAQGMWAHWRIHDVLEQGSILDPVVPPGMAGAPPLPSSPPNARLMKGTRGLPDGEIDRGTPIPGIVPIPNLPMATPPGKIVIDSGQVAVLDSVNNPGYPFFIAGVAGSRAPKPPLDFSQGNYQLVGDTTQRYGSLNGGLPRKVVVGGKVVFENHTIYDWTKITADLEAIQLPEDGTFFEKAAMRTHAIGKHPSFVPYNGQAGNFVLNGLPPVPGAPYANPSRNIDGTAAYPDLPPRIYKAANIQIDAVINKQGWHYPQTRPIVLWGDVASTVAGDRPPQPFFFRANSQETIEYHHTNLVPEYYELDDYQVRTPTDVIGQHIHLVKFDVTSSDGAANGWNYEDATYSPDMVRHSIEEINDGGKWFKPNLNAYYDTPLKDFKKTTSPSDTTLIAHQANPIWGTPPSGQNWDGAQTTVQRWYADPLFNNAQTVDRTLRTVFTHDHLSPSTHQQIGLYAGLLIEPESSTWLNSSTGAQLGVARPATNPSNDVTRSVPVAYTRNADGTLDTTSTATVADGGPTNWQAIIQTTNTDDSYREFMYEFQDNQQAYLAGSRGTPDAYPEWTPSSEAASFKVEVDTGYRGWIDPTFAIAAPSSPEVVSTGARGILSMNYRNEPLPARVAPGTGLTAEATNLAYAFSSQVTRGISSLNSQPTPGALISPDSNEFRFPVQPIGPGMEPGDPFTQLARGYAGDRIQVRTLVGSHVNPHFFNIHGQKWFFEPSATNSGFRSVQAMGISEHFEMNFTLPNVDGVGEEGTTDYLVKTNTDETGMQGGSWGIMRSYSELQSDLNVLPNNTTPNGQGKSCGCPTSTSELMDPTQSLKTRNYDITAISIDKYNMMGENWGKLPYNEKYRNYDTQSIIFVRTEELNDFMSGNGYRPEPLVLRAAAGECVKVTLRNQITPDFVALSSSWVLRAVSYNYTTSYTVGLHPELLSYDVSQYDGANVGFNSGDQTLNQGDGTVNYEWYAGQWTKSGSSYKAEPVELGSSLLSSPDPLQQYLAGLFGAIIIEPEGSYWVVDENQYKSHTSANVFADSLAYVNGEDPLFREFVMIFQDNLSHRAEPRGDLYGAELNSAVNYRTEPLGSRVFKDNTDLNSSNQITNSILNFNPENIYDIFSNGASLSDPETPVFTAKVGTPVRMRVLHTGGHGDGNVFDLHGHVWQEEPYLPGSKVIGDNPESQWNGTRGQLGSFNTFEIVIAKAGGAYEVPGDYMYMDWRAAPLTDGTWGIFRVTENNARTIITNVTASETDETTIVLLSGTCTVDPNTGKYPRTVRVKPANGRAQTARVNPANGKWEILDVRIRITEQITVSSILVDGSAGDAMVHSSEQLKDLRDGRQLELKELLALPPGREIEPGVNSNDLPIQPSRALRPRPGGPRR